MRRLHFLFALLLLAACTAVQPVDPASAQLQARSAWQRPWRGVWELSWPQAPLSGSIVFEGWQTESGFQRRYEILEASVPSLVGLAYINDGVSATYYNRLDAADPVTDAAQTLPFSPISDALTAVDILLAQAPQSAKRQAAGDSIIELTLSYIEGQSLTLWLDTQTNLIIRVELQSANTELTMAARSLEPLLTPHPKLFEISLQHEE